MPELYECQLKFLELVGTDNKDGKFLDHESREEYTLTNVPNLYNPNKPLEAYAHGNDTVIASNNNWSFRTKKNFGNGEYVYFQGDAVGTNEKIKNYEYELGISCGSKWYSIHMFTSVASSWEKDTFLLVELKGGNKDVRTALEEKDKKLEKFLFQTALNENSFHIYADDWQKKDEVIERTDNRIVISPVVYERRVIDDGKIPIPYDSVPSIIEFLEAQLKKQMEKPVSSDARDYFNKLLKFICGDMLLLIITKTIDAYEQRPDKDKDIEYTVSELRKLQEEVQKYIKKNNLSGGKTV